MNGQPVDRQRLTVPADTCLQSQIDFVTECGDVILMFSAIGLPNTQVFEVILGIIFTLRNE